MNAKVRQLVGIMPLIGIRVVGAALAGFLAVYVARLYGAQFSGEFFYAVSTLTIGSVITRLGVEPYLTSQVAGSSASKWPSLSYFANAFAAVTTLACAAGLGLWTVELVAGTAIERAIGGLPIYWLVLGVIGLNTSWALTGFCRAHGHAALSIFLETGLLSMWLLGLLEVTRYTDISPNISDVAKAVALMCPVLIAPLLLAMLRSRHDLLRWERFRHAFVGIWSYGAVTVTNGIIILIPLQALGWFSKTHDAGIYNAGTRVSMFVGAFGVVLKSIIVRRAKRGESVKTDRRRDVVSSAVMVLPWVAASLLVSWQSQWLVELFGSEFSEIKSIILVMLLAQCVNVVGFPIETYAVLADERRMLNITSATTLVVALAITPLLVWQFDLDGAVWSFAITITVSRLQLVWLYLRSPRIPQGTHVKMTTSREQ